ncbi:MAG: GPW/gp25 family protein [Bacteroidota bacterium]
MGWKFPPTFDKHTKSVEMVSEEADIQESLHILLSTRPGERIMLPEYGCDTYALVFEAIDATNISVMKRMIERAILYFEPRITLNEVKISFVEETEGLLNIDLDYTIRKTNTRSNMVYPFYVLEGTDVRYQAG